MRKTIKFLKRITLTQSIFVGLVVGLLLGGLAPQWAFVLKPFRELFLHGVKCIVAPLIFSTIVTGVAASGSFKDLGRVGLRAFIYFEVVTTLALAVGLAAVNLLRPGEGVHLNMGLGDAGAKAAAASSSLSFGGFVEHLLPPNFIDAVVRGDVLQIVIFSLIFAFAALAVGDKAKPILAFSEALSEVMFRFTNYIMWLAPLGVAGALAASVAEHGLGVVLPLLKLVGTLYLALVVFVLVVLYPVCRIFKIPALAFARSIKNAVILSFATASSESAFPLALEALEEFGVPRRISSFVLPMGYSFNLDGSTLHLAVASVFVAQAAGVHLSLGQQLVMMLTLMLTTKGVAAVPRASIVVLSATLVTFGLPLEGVALILGVDTFMDMARTATNLLGNCMATVVIARTEGVKFSVEPARGRRAAS